jgi:hypothetical protein
VPDGATDDLASEYPALDADKPKVRLRFTEAIVNVRPQRVQRHTSLDVVLALCDFVPAQSAGHHHLAALCAGPHRVLHRSLHRLTIGCAAFDLRRDAFRHQPSIKLRSTDFLDLNLRGSAQELLQVGRQPLDLGATASDDDSRAGSVDVDRETTGVPSLNRHAGDRGSHQPFADKVADLQIFLKPLGIVAALVWEPPRIPRLYDTQSQSAWMRFLTHRTLLTWYSGSCPEAVPSCSSTLTVDPSDYRSSTSSVMWQRRRNMR